MPRKQPQGATYHQLSREKKRWKGKVQPVEIKIVPAAKDSWCSCAPRGGPGYVQVDGVVLCQECFRCFSECKSAAKAAGGE